MENEKRLIDANELTHFVEERAGGAWIYKPDFLWAVRQQPTVDAVEVVRCMDCKNMIGKGLCSLHSTPVIRMDFCSFGERKEDNE